MNRNPVLVRNITHLTDARYFAAMEVDWMSMPLTADPGSFSLWHTLKDWIEGVKLAAEISSDDEMLMAKTLIDAKPEAIITNQPILLDRNPGVPIFYETNSLAEIENANDQTRILILKNPLAVKDVILQLPYNRIFIQASWTVSILQSLLHEGYQGGICFSGGKEESKGVRDFEIMDDLLGLLIP